MAPRGLTPSGYTQKLVSVDSPGDSAQHCATPKGGPMATINSQKIGSVASVNPGSTSHFQWNNPPWGTVLGYFAYPVPQAASGPHGSHTGSVQITSVTCTHIRDNYNGDKKYVSIEILNTGTEATGFDLYESWIS